MSKEDTRESRINTLKQTQESRKQDSLEKVYKAIERLQKINVKINFQTIAKEANVSVSYLYKYPELKHHIAEIRSKQNSMPITPVAKPNSSATGKIISKFRERIGKLEAEISELKRENESLAGQVYRVHFLNGQVERQKAEIERQRELIATLEARLSSFDKEKQESKVIPMPSKSPDVNSDRIKEELKTLGIRLNNTLSKKIKAAPEEKVLEAIEALKDQLTRGDVQNPGGWLASAIENGWTKAEIIAGQPKPRYQPPPPPVTDTSEEDKKEVMDRDLLANQLKQVRNKGKDNND